MDPKIPDKVYFKIGEAAEIVGVKPHVLRFWETEFPQVRPDRVSSKQRLFRRRDVEAFLEIKRLLYDEGFTIAGARKQLGASADPSASTSPKDSKDTLRTIRAVLKDIKKVLDDQ